LDELDLTDAGGEDPDGAVRGARGAGAELHVRQWTLECCILRTSMTRNGVKSASFPLHSLHSAEDFLNIYISRTEIISRSAILLRLRVRAVLHVITSSLAIVTGIVELNLSIMRTSAFSSAQITQYRIKWVMNRERTVK
jgi:hypothetical protein